MQVIYDQLHEDRTCFCEVDDSKRLDIVQEYLIDKNPEQFTQLTYTLKNDKEYLSQAGGGGGKLKHISENLNVRPPQSCVQRWFIFYPRSLFFKIWKWVYLVACVTATIGYPYITVMQRQVF